MFSIEGGAMENSRQEHAQKLTMIARVANINAALFDVDGRRLSATDFAPGCALCQCMQDNREGMLRCAEFHQSAGYTAYRTGEAYIARCHIGAITITAPIIRDGRYDGSAALEPLWMWEWDEYAASELILRAEDLGLSEHMLIEAGAAVPCVDSARVRALMDLLWETITPFSEDLLLQRALSDQQRHISQLILDRKHELDGDGGGSPIRPHDYPIHIEREMLGRVRLGDKNGARAMLNELLAHIFLRSPGNMELMKARLLELVVMISRAAVESGAELERLLGLNYNFISEVSGIDGYEELCAWVVKVLDTFLDTVYESRNLPNSRQLTDALSYIRSHYMQNLSLEEVAAQVFVSPFYLSHMFKEKLGVTFVEYLTRVRVEMAKSYLLNTQMSVSAVAEKVGYEDSSYFGKVFKKMTGTTPKGFRRGR